MQKRTPGVCRVLACGGGARRRITCRSEAAVFPIVATNYVLVTNMVVVTNYFVTTNVVLGTNAFAFRPSSSALPDLSWVPPEDSFDWIQIKSGEWLKGSIKAMQAEYRWRFTERLGVVAFGGVGSVAPEFGRFDQLLPSVRIGLRYVLAKQNNVGLRFDAAWGRDEHTFYVGIGEAF